MRALVLTTIVIGLCCIKLYYKPKEEIKPPQPNYAEYQKGNLNCETHIKIEPIYEPWKCGNCQFIDFKKQLND